MTQKEFSAAVGISQGTLSDIEKDKCYPATETLLSVFRYINISADWLLKGVGLGPTNSDEQLISDLIASETQEITGQNLDNAANIPTSVLTVTLRNYFFSHSAPELKEWVELFESAPIIARPVLLNAARAIAQSYPQCDRDPIKALSTSQNTGEDEQAAAESDIA